MRQAARVHKLTEREPEVAPAAAARLSVSLVGRLAIRFNGPLVELRTQKAAAVLSYLAIPSKRIEHAGITYKASGLSAVVTHPAHRRRGHGRLIVTVARELIASSDADIGVFTCDVPLTSFYVECGWTAMESTHVIGGTRKKPFPAEPLNKRTLMGFFSEKAKQRAPDFANSLLYLELREGDLW